VKALKKTAGLGGSCRSSSSRLTCRCFAADAAASSAARACAPNIGVSAREVKSGLRFGDGGLKRLACACSEARGWTWRFSRGTDVDESEIARSSAHSGTSSEKSLFDSNSVRFAVGRMVSSMRKPTGTRPGWRVSTVAWCFLRLPLPPAEHSQAQG